jgi:hemerythrin superfamily protein
MDAIRMLDEQHDEVDALFKEIEGAAPAAKRPLFEEIADALTMHATIEEKIFYPAVKARRTEDILLESLEEHLGIKRVLADLLGLPPGDETFDAKVKVLKEQVEHHVEEERTDLFPKVKKLLSKEQLEAIGQEMQALMAELEGTEPRRRVPEETQQAAPLL